MQRGDRVGRFEVVAPVASGGMGTVFRARDRRDQRDVALKALDSGGDAARFDREATLLAAIDHPGVVRYVAHGVLPVHHLVMEWIDGETLAARLARSGVDLRETVAVGVALAGALGALHAAGIVHRDVKPANVMLVGDTVKLVDFGIARPVGPRSNLTRTGSMIGTAGYMAPEQARGDAMLDGRADLFALGCILHECVAGEPAFRGGSLLALRAKVLLHDPPRLAQLVPGVPPALDALVGSLLARDAAARPADAAGVTRVLRELPVQATARRVVPASSETTDVSGQPSPRCAVIVVDTSTDSVETVACMPADALAIARERARGRLVAIGSGPSLAEAVDRAATLVGELELAAVADGTTPSGAWTDAASGAVLGLAGTGRIQIL